MKKVLCLLSLVAMIAMTSCGNASTEVKKVDSTTQKVDSTVKKVDSVKLSAKPLSLKK